MAAKATQGVAVMSCLKCGGLVERVAYGDFYESHDALHCLVCGRVEWLAPVPPSPPERVDSDSHGWRAIPQCLE